MVRINNSAAYIEKEKLPLYSFLINYDIGNIYFIRKDKALDNGVYRIVENGVSKIKTLSFLRSVTQLEYSKYSTTINQDYKDAHDFLLEYYEKIKNGTINY
jgi:hypothetical protein